MSCAAAAAHVFGYCTPQHRNFEPYTPDDDFGLYSVREPPTWVATEAILSDEWDRADEVGQILPRISLDRIQAVEAEAQKLEAAAQAHFGVPPKPNPDHPLGIWPWLQDWDIWLARWETWRAAHIDETSRIGNEVLAEFLAFKSEFNDLLARARSDGIATSAQPVPEGHADKSSLFSSPAFPFALVLGGVALAFGVGYALRRAA